MAKADHLIKTISELREEIAALRRTSGGRTQTG